MKIKYFMILILQIQFLYAITPSTNQFLPGIAHIKGDKNSFWVSDIRIFNYSSEKSNLEINFYSSQYSQNNISYDLEIDGYNSIFIDDILYSLFGIENTFGTINIKSNNPILAFSRTYSLQEGTYGQFIPGIPLLEALTKERTQYLLGVIKDSGKRTNLGIINFDETNFKAKISLISKEGNILSEMEEDLYPYQTIQINDIIEKFGFQNFEGGTIKIDGIEGLGWAYLSVIDNISNDPIFIPLSHDYQEDLINGTIYGTATQKDNEYWYGYINNLIDFYIQNKYLMAFNLSNIEDEAIGMVYIDNRNYVTKISFYACAFLCTSDMENIDFYPIFLEDGKNFNIVKHISFFINGLEYEMKWTINGAYFLPGYFLGEIEMLWTKWPDYEAPYNPKWKFIAGIK